MRYLYSLCLILCFLQLGFGVSRPHFATIDSLTDVIERDPQNHEALNERGELLYELQKYNRALSDFQRAVKLETLSPLYNKNRGEAYRALGDNVKALESYNRAIRLGKNSVVGYEAKLVYLLEEGKHKKAQKVFDKLMSIDIKPSKRWYYEGLFAEKSNKEQSVTYYKQALQGNPTLHIARLRIARLFFESKRYTEAESYIEEVLKFSPHNITALTLKSEILSHMEQYDKALEVCNQLLSFDSTNPAFWLNRGRCHLGFQKLHECHKDLQTAIRLDSTNMETVALQAEYYERDNRLSDAVRCYNKLLKRFPKNDNYYFRRAECRHTLGDFYNASEDYDKAIGLNKNSELYYNNSAANYSHMGWSKDAIKRYNVVLWMNPKAVYVYCNIGTEYFHAMDYEKSEFYLKKFLTMVTSDTDVKFVDLAQEMMAKIEKKKKEGKL